MATPLNRSQAVPLYHQLTSILLDDIRSGRRQPDDRLPNEDQLASTYGVSLITVRRALSDLAAEGYVRREQGRGTFVSHPIVVQGPRELTSFTFEMARRGAKSSSRVLATGVVPATDDLAEALNLLKGAPIFRLRRLRLADSEPLGIQTAYIPLALAPGLPEENFERASLYQLLEKKFHITAASAREIHSAVTMTAEECRLLDLPRRSVGLTVRRVTSTSERQPFEMVHSVMRADRYQVVLDLVCGKSR